MYNQFKDNQAKTKLGNELYTVLLRQTKWLQEKSIIFNPVLIGERNVPALTLKVYNFIKTLPNFASLSQIYLEKIGYYRLLCPELDVAMATAF